MTDADPRYIDRGGGKSPSDLKLRPIDHDRLSFWISPDLIPGGKREYIVVDTALLPPGSWKVDQTPIGHVSVFVAVPGVPNATVAEIQTAARRLTRG